MSDTMQGIVMRGVSKEFSGKFALKNVDITIKRGSVHAIVGENGAGKSTLMNVLSGVLTPTAGTFSIDGKAVSPATPKEASALGIGMVHQHFMLVPSLTVWQNVILGIEPLLHMGKINQKAAIDMIGKACRDYSMDVNPQQIVGTLTVGEQQRIEILKVLVRSANYIILDEPTAVLTPQEINRLFDNILALKKLGKTIIFISHKLEEVLSIADEITVLRLGEKIGTLPRDEATPDKLIGMMVGRAVKIEGFPLRTERGQLVLSVEKLSTPRSQFASGLHDISLDVASGEVLGIAGVDGNGQNDLIRAVLGLELICSGRVVKDGVDITHMSAPQIRKSGVSLIPPDRQTQGLVMNNSIIANTLLGCEDDPGICHMGVIRSAQATARVANLTAAYDVRMPSVYARASELSGGNQQKLILAREFGVRKSNLVLAVNPTRGLDIGAIEFVYGQIEAQKKAGKAVLLVSTELSEILRLSDRIAVLFKGRLMGIVPREAADVDHLGRLMMGLSDESEAANA